MRQETAYMAVKTDAHLGGRSGEQHTEFSLAMQKIIHSPAKTVLFCGDMLDQRASLQDAENFLVQLGLLKQAGKEVLLIFGNHEERLAPAVNQAFREGLQVLGVDLLENDMKVIGNTAFIGLSGTLDAQTVTHLGEDRDSQEIKEKSVTHFKSLLALAEAQGLLAVVAVHVPLSIGNTGIENLPPVIAKKVLTSLGVEDIDSTGVVKARTGSPLEKALQLSDSLGPNVAFVASGHVHGDAAKEQLPGTFFAITPSGVPSFNIAATHDKTVYIALPDEALHAASGVGITQYQRTLRRDAALLPAA